MDPQELAQVPLFGDLPPDDLEAVATYADEVTVSSGKHLVDQGGYAYDLFAILEGKAQVIVDGEEVGELGPGDFFGETGVLEKEKRNATVVAKTRMRLATLTGWDLRRMRNQLGPAMEKLQKAIEERRRPLDAQSSKRTGRLRVRAVTRGASATVSCSGSARRTGVVVKKPSHVLVFAGVRPRHVTTRPFAPQRIVACSTELSAPKMRPAS